MELVRHAEACGMELEAYIVSLSEQAGGVNRRGMPNQSLEEFEQSLDRIAQFSEKIPALPDEALVRENLDQDHD